ncbi:hypothetical protein ADL21_28650 [Streptomyces albus subsp. albus]|nr:hypothetical protein ADL21_28650 [Streptomyces albus subsp. albus]
MTLAFLFRHQKSGLFLGVQGDSKDPSKLTELQGLRPLSGLAAQTWILSSAGAGDVFEAHARNRHSGLYLNVVDYNSEPGAAVEQWNFQDTNRPELAKNFKVWRIEPAGIGSVAVKNRKSGLYLTPRGFNGTEKAIVEQQPLAKEGDPNRDSQLWQLIPVGAGLGDLKAVLGG